MDRNFEFRVWNRTNPPMTNKGYTETTLKGLIKRAGGKDKLKELLSAEKIADRLFDLESDWIKELFRKGHSEVGELHGQDIWQLAYDLEDQGYDDF